MYISPRDILDHLSLRKVRQQVDTLVNKLRHETQV